MRASIKYVVEDVDRHGNVRLYFKRRGCRKIRLPAKIGTPEFWNAYNAAAEAKELAPKKQNAGRKPADGSMRALVVNYYQSDDYKRLAPRTQRVRRLVLDAFCKEHGAKPYAKLLPRHVRRFRDAKIATPEAANDLVKYLRQVFAVGIESDMCDTNPAASIKRLRSKGTGFHSWTPQEVAQFEARHPLGTKARLAMALLLYTGQRRSDIVEFGRQHVRDGWLHFTQAKNRNRNPVTMDLPVVPALQAVIDASPTGDLTFLVTEFRRPFTANGFGNWFRERCNEAGLPHCSAHGLRKASAARLAESAPARTRLPLSPAIRPCGRSSATRARRNGERWRRRPCHGSMCRAKARTNESHFSKKNARWDSFSALSD
jgi:integrase